MPRESYVVLVSELCILRYYYPLDVAILMKFFLSPGHPTCTTNPLQIDTIMYKFSAMRQECKATILMRGCEKNNVIIAPRACARG